MTNWTAEECQAMEEVARLPYWPVPNLDAWGLRLWAITTSAEAIRCALACRKSPDALEAPHLEELLASVASLAPRVGSLGGDDTPPSPEAWRQLLEEADALAACAARVRWALPPRPDAKGWEATARTLGAMCRELPGTVRRYAERAPEVCQ